MDISGPRNGHRRGLAPEVSVATKTPLDPVLFLRLGSLDPHSKTISIAIMKGIKLKDKYFFFQITSAEVDMAFKNPKHIYLHSCSHYY